MKISPSTKGFYDVFINAEIPEDAIDIPDELYIHLRDGQTGGRYIAFSADGYPYLAEPAPLTNEELSADALIKRDFLLRESTLRIAPLQDAVDLDDATIEEVSLLTAWKQYRVALNRLPDSLGWPVSIVWPVAPSD